MHRGIHKVEETQKQLATVAVDRPLIRSLKHAWHIVKHRRIYHISHHIMVEFLKKVSSLPVLGSIQKVLRGIRIQLIDVVVDGQQQRVGELFGPAPAEKVLEYVRELGKGLKVLVIVRTAQIWKQNEDRLQPAYALERLRGDLHDGIAVTCGEHHHQRWCAYQALYRGVRVDRAAIVAHDDARHEGKLLPELPEEIAARRTIQIQFLRYVEDEVVKVIDTVDASDHIDDEIIVDALHMPRNCRIPSRLGRWRSHLSGSSWLQYELSGQLVHFYGTIVETQLIRYPRPVFLSVGLSVCLSGSRVVHSVWVRSELALIIAFQHQSLTYLTYRAFYWLAIKIVYTG